jgi:hypothetical protein
LKSLKEQRSGVIKFLLTTAGINNKNIHDALVDMLELTALPSIDEELWVPMVKETDVLLVNGGEAP